MPTRELTVMPDRSGIVRFVLRGDGPIPEAEIEKELLSFVFVSDPALDNRTGRLVPGWRSSQMTTSLFLSEPDADGIAHLGGILCAGEHSERLAQLASEHGYVVVRNV